jgi:tetratricopeptide (TPR) repeat protein
LDPKNDDAQVWYADLLFYQGRSEEALGCLDRLLACDPSCQWAGLKRAWILFATGEYRAALEQIWQSLMMDPEFGLGHFLLGLIYQQMEMPDDAATELETARRSSPVHPAVLAALGHLYSATGDSDRARVFLSELTDLSEVRYVSPYCFAVVHAGLGNRDASVAELQRALELRDIQLQWAFVDPRLEELRRSDGRVALVLPKMGLRASSGSPVVPPPGLSPGR